MYYTGQEGYGRFTPADRRKFYIYSRGSFEETKAWLRKLIKRKIVNEADVSKYQTVIDKLGPKLNAFINSTKNNNTNFQFLISNCEQLQNYLIKGNHYVSIN